MANRSDLSAVSFLVSVVWATPCWPA